MKLSISKIKLFKACRRAYQLKYIEGLEPVQTSDSRQTGLSYHEKLEQLYTNGDFDHDLSKESAMALAYKKYIYPQFNCHKAEEWIEMDLPGGDKLIGRLDGISDDGLLVEHKTTSQDITEEYEYNLQWDEQILAYMLMTGAREIYYTVIRRPTIRQKKNETEEEFFWRMVEWYDEETESKIRLLRIGRTDEEIDEFRKAVEAMATEINSASNFYRNTAHCRCYHTMCDYASVCLYYNPDQEYIDFTKEKRDGNS